MGVDLDYCIICFIDGNAVMPCTDPFSESFGPAQRVLRRVLGAKVACHKDLVNYVLIPLRGKLRVPYDPPEVC